MKILNVFLNSFRSAHDLSLDTNAPRVLIAGGNHAGKTSVREGIRWALTGRASVTDAKGTGSERLIPAGATVANVTLTVEGIGGINRQFGPGHKAFAVEGFTGEGATQQQALYAKLGTTQAYLDAVLDTGSFLRLHHIDAKALILALLDVRILIDGVSGSPFTLDEIDAMYKAAFENRKTAKIKLKNFSLPLLPISPMNGGGQPPTVEAIQEQLTKLRGVLEQATVGAGQSATKRTLLQEQLRKAEAFVPFVGGLTREAATAEIDTLDAQVAAYEADLEAAVTSPVTPPAPTDEAGRLTRTITLLVEHRPTKGCVLDGAVPCETHKLKFTNRAKDLQKTLDDLQANDPGLEVFRPQPTLESPLKAARRRLQVLRIIVGQYDQSAIFERDHEKLVAQLTLELQGLASPVVDETKVAELRERIKKGEALLQAARTYWTALYQHQEGLKTQATLTAEVETLEKAVELYGPNGVRTEALKASIEGFELLINRWTQSFGWEIRFTMDPWGVEANGRPVDTYSESEQYLIGMAIQLAIASVSGLSFAVVDRLDMLDVAHRTIATDILLGCALDQVFILATREPSQALPVKAGLAAFRLVNTNGRTGIAEAVTA